MKHIKQTSSCCCRVGMPLRVALSIAAGVLCFGDSGIAAPTPPSEHTTAADFSLVENIEALRGRIDSVNFPISESAFMELMASPLKLVPIRGSMRDDVYVEDFGIEGCDPSFGFLAVRVKMQRDQGSRMVLEARLVFLLYNGTEFTAARKECRDTVCPSRSSLGKAN